MRVYVVYDFWEEVDDGKTVRQGRSATELELQDLEGQNGIEIMPSIIPLANQMAKAGNFAKVVIINVVPLPLVGMGQSKIIRPQLFKPGGP